MAASTPKAQSSQWAVEPGDRPPEARVHPRAARGFADGEHARLESRRGALDVIVRLDGAMRPELALLPKGGMMRRNWCANLLVEAVETDRGTGAAYYDEPVRLVKRATAAR